MAIVKATYTRENLTTVELSAEIWQDSGSHCDSELLIIWTDECLDALAEIDLDAEERVGVTEAIELAFWDDADADTARVRSAQQRGDQAFFDARNAARKIEAA